MLLVGVSCYLLSNELGHQPYEAEACQISTKTLQNTNPPGLSMVWARPVMVSLTPWRGKLAVFSLLTMAVPSFSASCGGTFATESRSSASGWTLWQCRQGASGKFCACMVVLRSNKLKHHRTTMQDMAGDSRVASETLLCARLSERGAPAARWQQMAACCWTALHPRSWPACVGPWQSWAASTALKRPSRL